MNNSPNLFTFIDQLRSKSTQYPYDAKLASGYMLTLGLSNNNNDLKYCNEINHLLWSMPNDMIYKYYFEAIPKGKVWAKWPKKEKNKELEKEINELKEKYNISTYEARKLLEE